MGVHSVTITTNTTTKICDITKPRDYHVWLATLGAKGTWGGTTLTWKWSVDGGVNLYPITTAPGSAVTSTNDDSFDVELGISQTNTPASLYAVTTGGTGASITVLAVDNRG